MNKLIIETFDNIAKEFNKSPYKILYEADAQAFVSNELSKVFNESHNVNLELDSKEIININIGKVHREYPYKGLFDVVVLDDAPLANISKNQLYDQRVKYAFEVKVAFYGHAPNKCFDFIKDDYYRMIKKYKNLKLNGLARDFLGYQITFFPFDTSKKDFDKYVKKNEGSDWMKGLIKRKIENPNMDIVIFSKGNKWACVSEILTIIL